jgi:hypothetical protein
VTLPPVGAIVRVTLHGVREDGTDQDLFGARVVAIDGARLILHWPEQRDRELAPNAMRSLTRRRRWEMRGVKPGTLATVHPPDEPGVPCSVTRGYGQRLSLATLPPAAEEA